MGVLTLFEIISSFAQYLGIIGSVKINWPPSLSFVGQYLRYLRVDFSVPLPNFKLPALDFRAQHIVLSNVIPLAITFVLLIFFKSAKVVVWYAALLFCLGVAIAGIVLKFLPAGQFSDQLRMADAFLIGGFSGIVALLSVFYVRKFWIAHKRNRKVAPAPEEAQYLSRDSLQHDEDLEDDNDTPDLTKISKKNRHGKKSFFKMTRNFMISAIMIAVGAVAANVIDTSLLSSQFYYYSTVQAQIQRIGTTIGYVLIGFGSVLMYNWITGNFEAGRRFNTRLNYIFRKNVIKLTLFLLGVLYIPMTTSILSMTYCDWVTCPIGQEFIVRSVNLDVGSLSTEFQQGTYNKTACTPCLFDKKVCPIADDLCPQTQDLRLVVDESMSCSQEIYPFYLPGTVLMFFTITIGVPCSLRYHLWAFYKLISLSSRFVREIPAGGENQQQRWRFQCFLSSNSCRSLYSMFEFQWRYYKLFTIVHKLVLVTIFIFGGKSSFILVASLAVLHTAFACLSIYSRPYVSKAEDFLATICLLVNAMNAIIAFLVAINITLPNFIGYYIAAANVIAPILALCIGTYVEYKENKKLNERRKLREEKLQPMNKDSSGSSKSLNKSKKGIPIDIATEQLIDSLDQELDHRLLRILVNFFLFMGVAAFLSLCCTAIGLIQLSSNTSVIQAPIPSTLTTEQAIAQYEFAGYLSWNEFTSKCCCQMKSDNSTVVKETWKCIAATSVGDSKFTYKEKIRVIDSQSGLIVRPYCSPTFDATRVCSEPTYNVTEKRFVIKVCPNVDIPTNVTKYLW